MCVRCGGPQVWTSVRGETWVACQADCIDDQVDMFGRNPPLVALCEEPEETPKAAGVEHSGGEGVVPLEGGATNGSDEGTEWPGDPPQAFLDSMWEGYDG